MKKYLVGLSAIIIAIASVAFTAPVKKTTSDVRFKFVGSDPTAPLDWEFNDGSFSCSQTLDACVIEVPESVVSGSGDRQYIDESKLNTLISQTTLPMTSSSGHTRPNTAYAASLYHLIQNVGN